MKARNSLITLLFFLLGIQVGFSQNFNDRNLTVPLPGQVKAMAAKCNQTLFGKNAFVFEPSMNMDEIQTLIDSMYAGQVYPNNEFSKNRYALLFKPGTYHLDVRVGYYMHIMGLGNSPEDVVIVGAVRSNGSQGHSLCNFWRTAENLTIVPAIDSTNTWAVSQAAPLRRVYVKGNLKLFDGGSSGGFMANCKIDGTVFSGSQQQWLTRNTEFKKWEGGVWNMMYVGVVNAPKENWPDKPVTTINETPEVREKPYWIYSEGKYLLKIPAIKKNSTGVDWDHQSSSEKNVSIDAFYLANPNLDNAKSINKALKKGKHILFTPGIYTLSESLKITYPGTIVLGMGMATLVPEKGNMAIEVSDVDGVTISSLIIDAAFIPSETLVRIGEAKSKKSHQANPTFLFDVFFRVGGPHEGSASNCLMINSNNVFIDHAWFWRADHGNGIGWDKSRSANGLIVNGDDVTIYGLFNEHFQEYQTIWNGEKGCVYFYQCEMPYDVPSPEAWKHAGINGYASYKVGDHVKKHQAWGIGIYCFFDIPIIIDQAIETPAVVENRFYHKVLKMLGWNKPTKTVVKSVINGKGGELDTNSRTRTME
jgi:hypothetical protein